MKPAQIMIVAGEASGDLLAAELVRALRKELIARQPAANSEGQPLRTRLEPRFFGAGGPLMAEAGVELAFDLSQHSVIGISDVLKNYLKFRRLFRQLLAVARERQPDVIVGVDYGGFNLRFGHAIRRHVRSRRGAFNNWNPKLVQFVSPQVWASRAGRAYQLERDYDLLLSIFPFEKNWYAQHVPRLRVEFVGHPMLDRYTPNTPEGRVTRVPDSLSEGRVTRVPIQTSSSEMGTRVTRPSESGTPAESGTPVTRPSEAQIVLLPGSRAGELHRHLPVILAALKLVECKQPSLQATMVLPNDTLAQLAKSLGAPPNLQIQVGHLPAALSQADLAIASTGTVTMECALFGVPAVALYKTSWMNYQIARRIVKVKSITMPNLLAREEIFPEFVQHAATSENIAGAALELLQDPQRQARVRKQLATVVESLGGPGATARAASAIAELLR